MWNFAPNCNSGHGRSKSDRKLMQAAGECSDDEVSSIASRDEGLECPICWELFNVVENVPYVLWCGHTLCKNCIIGLQWAVVKFPTLPIQLPLFISCPWCNLLSFRLVYKGNLRFPRKNYFLLWMVENMNGDRGISSSSFREDHQPAWSSGSNVASGSRASRSNLRRGQNAHHSEPSGSNHNHHPITAHLSIERVQSAMRKSLVFFVHMTAKFPLVIIFLLIVIYAIPASAAILALYMLITVLFALPSFLILYFAYPSLDWLVREIIT
ncbi:uncharacterized protein LOC116207515 [Punica granatum]|uniref:Uncharacterized protein LOC116207515 n=2 Tax=Punica granatum TaxID=22663 RepID=A0A6P8DVT3_PUNGR|nr:uncharacterized protein LOC116207515 [Punica granatum]XP_031396348.1 uncharacterized protein LOC116207515 [Punica granatum]OWM64545.1 hypothetical protein CDL15_Pgr020512 [Punica granatum]PKI47939.1 hypothetical protein CRG98_031723 [Punica granatum]